MTNRLAEQLPNDGQVGDYRFVRHISTDKRASVARTDQLPDGRTGIFAECLRVLRFYDRA